MHPPLLRPFLVKALPVLLLAQAAVVACTQAPIAESDAAAFAQRRADVVPDTAGYQRRAPQDPNGIGKYYMGRQIAHVMSHDGADWLERAGRNEEEGIDILLRELKLKPTDVVADIGAGTGYLSFQLSPLVPQGKVLAVDIQPEMLQLLRQKGQQKGMTNVQPVLGRVDTPNLPASSVDVVLLVDSYHEFDHPREMMRAIRNSLKPGGRVVLVEYRAEDRNLPIKRIHRMSLDQARLELEAVGLQFVDDIGALPKQHMFVFRRP